MYPEEVPKTTAGVPAGAPLDIFREEGDDDDDDVIRTCGEKGTAAFEGDMGTLVGPVKLRCLGRKGKKTNKKSIRSIS